jgi:hypothetical protein
VDNPESRATLPETSTPSCSIAASNLYPALDDKKMEFSNYSITKVWEYHFSLLNYQLSQKFIFMERNKFNHLIISLTQTTSLN